MPIINKVSSELVFDLLNQANPNSPVKFSANNLNLGKLTAITPPAGQIQNTKIMLSNKPTSEYIGRVEATYRRLDLSKLFRGLTITLAKFSPMVKSGSSTAWASFVKDLLPTFNAQMGTAFTADDLTDFGISRGTLNAQNRYQSTVTVNAKATSLAYVGSFSFTWVDAPQDIDAVVTVTDLDGRVYPGGNVFDDSHALVLNQAAYGVDWTDVIDTTLKNLNVANVDVNYFSANGQGGPYVWTTGTNSYFNTAFLALLDALNGLYPELKLARADMLSKWSWSVITLPSAAYPEANPEFFNRALVMFPIDLTSSKTTAVPNGYVGNLIFHFNV